MGADVEDDRLRLDMLGHESRRRRDRLRIAGKGVEPDEGDSWRQPARLLDRRDRRHTHHSRLRTGAGPSRTARRGGTGARRAAADPRFGLRAAGRSGAGGPPGRRTRILRARAGAARRPDHHPQMIVRRDRPKIGGEPLGQRHRHAQTVVGAACRVGAKSRRIFPGDVGEDIVRLEYSGEGERGRARLGRGHRPVHHFDRGRGVLGETRSAGESGRGGGEQIGKSSSSCLHGQMASNHPRRPWPARLAGFLQTARPVRPKASRSGLAAAQWVRTHYRQRP